MSKVKSLLHSQKMSQYIKWLHLMTWSKNHISEYYHKRAINSCLALISFQLVALVTNIVWRRYVFTKNKARFSAFCGSVMCEKTWHKTPRDQTTFEKWGECVAKVTGEKLWGEDLRLKRPRCFVQSQKMKEGKTYCRNCNPLLPEIDFKLSF